jgi:WD40 repeat protein
LAYPTPLWVAGTPVRTLDFHPDGTQLAVNAHVLSVPRDAVQPRLRAEGLAQGSQAIFQGNGEFWAVDFPTGALEDKDFRLLQGAPRQRDVVLKPPPTSHLKSPPLGLEGNPVPVYRLLGNVALTPDGRYAAAACQLWWRDRPAGAIADGAGCLAVWDLSADAAPAVGTEANLSAVALSRDGRLAATAGGWKIHVWNVATAKQLRTIEHVVTSGTELKGADHMERSGQEPYRYWFKVHCVLFSADGDRVYSGGADGRLGVGDVRTGRELAAWEGHRGPLLSLALSPDGRLLASGGADQAVRLWDAATSRELARWDAHDGDVAALAFSPDGTLLASGGSDGAVKLWDLPAIRKGLVALGLDW